MPSKKLRARGARKITHHETGHSNPGGGADDTLWDETLHDISGSIDYEVNKAALEVLDTAVFEVVFDVTPISKINRRKSSTEAFEYIWDTALKLLKGFTSDMARDFTKVELAGAGKFIVTLSDKVNRDFCSKPDRKQQMESALSAVAGRSMKVKFLATSKASQGTAKELTLTERNHEAILLATAHLDQLSETWAEIEKTLLDNGVLAPVEVGAGYEYYDPASDPIGLFQLGLQKVKSRWRVCCRLYLFDAPEQSTEWTPVTESTIESRMELLDHVDKLHKAIVESNEENVSKIKQASDKSKAILERLRG